MSIATEIAEEIRAKIRVTTGLTASAGISYNKFLAKMASGQNKPNGQFLITPKNGARLSSSYPSRNSMVSVRRRPRKCIG
jgi:DNA polymerase-4